MTLSEKFENVNIFELINNKKPVDIIGTSLNVTSLNNTYLYKYGFRTVSEKLVDMNIDTIIDMIVDNYVDKWNSIYKVYNESATRESFGGEHQKTTHKDTTDDTFTKGTKTETNNKLSPYNDNTFQDDTLTTEVNSGSDTNKTVRDRLYSKDVVKGSDIVSYKDTLNYLKKTNIYDIIYTDLNRFLTYSIF